MSSQNVIMSRIMEHNIHNNTDSLYNPLRNALKKSVLPAQTHYNHKNFTPDKLSNSCITQDFRVLSSAEAENIWKNTFISANKELVPTNHIEKVIGKHFYAVDIEEKIGEPITEEQLKSLHTNQYQEIVYEFKQTDQPSLFSQPEKTLSSLHKLKTIHTTDSAQEYPKPSLIGIERKQLEEVRGQTYTIYEDSNATSKVSNLSVNSGVKPYQFSDKMKSQKNSSRIQLKGRKSDNYQYNLFSIIDQPINAGCKPGCFSKNQIVASKRTAAQWK